MLMCVQGRQAAGGLEVKQAGTHLPRPHHVGVLAEVDLDGGLINTLQAERAVCRTQLLHLGPEAREFWQKVHFAMKCTLWTDRG